MKLKFILLLSLSFATYFTVSAQVRLDPYYPYSDWTIGGGAGFSEIYGSLSHPNSEPVFRVNAEHNTNMWVNLGLEVQRGAFSEYEVKNTWTNGMSIYNQYTALNLNAKVSLGEFFKYPKNFFCKTLFGLYAGVGIGYMWNDVSNITLKFKHQDKYTITDYYGSSVLEQKTSNFYIPYNLGFNLHLTRRCMFNINYQFAYAFSSYLDGYNFQEPYATHKYNDFFSVLSFGLNFYIGKVGYHHKKHGIKY